MPFSSLLYCEAERQANGTAQAVRKGQAMGYKKSVDWFQMWFEDKQSMLVTMHRNMSSDIDAGYNPCGQNIKRQREAIDEYSALMDRQMLALSAMEADRANKWCYYDMVKRGAISA